MNPLALFFFLSFFPPFFPHFPPFFYPFFSRLVFFFCTGVLALALIPPPLLGQSRSPLNAYLVSCWRGLLTDKLQGTFQVEDRSREFCAMGRAVSFLRLHSGRINKKRRGNAGKQKTQHLEVGCHEQKVRKWHGEMGAGSVSTFSSLSQFGHMVSDVPGKCPCCFLLLWSASLQSQPRKPGCSMTLVNQVDAVWGKICCEGCAFGLSVSCGSRFRFEGASLAFRPVFPSRGVKGLSRHLRERCVRPLNMDAQKGSPTKRFGRASSEQAQ